MLDSLLDIVCILGDTLFFLSTVPVRHAVSWWHDIFHHKKQAHPVTFHSPTHCKREDATESSPGNSSTSLSLLAHVPRNAQFLARKGSARNIAIRRRSAELQPSSSNSSRAHIPTRYPPETRVNTKPVAIRGRGPTRGRRNAAKSSPPQRQPPNNEEAHPMVSNYQIWYPPSSFEEPSENEHFSPPDALGRLPTQSSLDASLDSIITEGHVDEWRSYPPFPAAYPLTPCPVPSVLQSSAFNRSTITHSPVDISAISPIRDDAPTGPQQEIGRPFPTRGLLNSGLDNSSSDGDSLLDGHADRSDNDAGTFAVDNQDESGDDDDDVFDVTLTSPVVVTRVRSGVSNSSTAGSVKSRPTALTTTDNASSRHARTNSESSGSISISDSMSISDSSSMAERKRVFLPPNNYHMTSTIMQRVSASQAVSPQEPFLRMVSKAGDDDTSDSDSDDSGTSSDSDEMEQRKRGNLVALRDLSENTRPSTRRADPRRIESSLNIPPAKPKPRPLDVARVPQRTSARLASLGAAPPISRRVTAPAAGSSYTSVHTASTVFRRASDKNSSKKKGMSK